MPRNCPSEFSRRGSDDTESVKEKERRMDSNDYISSMSYAEFPPDDLPIEEEEEFSRIVIQSHIRKTASIGISEALVRNHSGILIEIAYCDKTGKQWWPGTYFISKSDLLKYPVKEWKGRMWRYWQGLPCLAHGF